MEVLPIFKEQLGKKTLTEISLNPLYFSDFNRLRFELISHYQSACENLTSSSLWLDIGRNSELELTFQRLNLKNDLSYFPVPFFDPRDNRTNTLPMVFAGTPDKGCSRHQQLSLRGLVHNRDGVVIDSLFSMTSYQKVMQWYLPLIIDDQTFYVIIRW